MPRDLVRYQLSWQFHFVTFSCYRRRPYLESAKTYAVFEQEFEVVRLCCDFVVAGYVLMPEHMHLFVGEPRRSSQATVLQVLKQQTSRKLTHPQSSQFWEQRYYDFNVYNSTKVPEKLKYMHRNPVKRGLVVEPQDWPWSSFRHYATGEAGTVEIESHWTAERREASPERTKEDS